MRVNDDNGLQKEKFIPFMTSKLPIGLFCLCLLAWAGCTITSSSLQEKEKGLVGNWLKPDNGDSGAGWYMKFHDDRTGAFGLAVNIDGKLGMQPYMSMVIKDWRIQNDTLSLQYELQPGYAVYGPDGKELKGNNKPGYSRYIVSEISDTVIVLEDLIAEFPGTKLRLKKSERLELFRE